MCLEKRPFGPSNLEYFLGATLDTDEGIENKSMLPFHKNDEDKIKEILSYPALNQRKNARVVFKLWIRPSFSPWIGWGLIKDEGQYFVRRIILVANPEKYKLENDTFGSEAEISSAEAERIISELKRIQIKPFEYEEIIGLDGDSYGISIEEFSVQIELNWWEEGPKDWEELGNWFKMAINEFQKLLPQSGNIEL